MLPSKPFCMMLEGGNNLHIKQLLQGTEEFNIIANGVEKGIKEQLVSGLTGSLRTFFIAGLQERLNRSILIVTHNLLQAQKVQDDLTEWLPDTPVYLYSTSDLVSAELSVESPEFRAARMDVLNALTNPSEKPSVIVAPISGLRRLLPPKSLWKQYQYTLSVGDDLSLDAFLEQLVESGYARTSFVSKPGEFSLRGGILDIYPLTEEHPVRVELFDTEIDSIRYFDSETQRSLEMMRTISFGPASEWLLRKEHLVTAGERLEETLKETIKKVKDQSIKEQLIENITYEIDQLKNGQVVSSPYKYMSLYYEQCASLLDYVREDSVIIMDEISRIQEISQNLDKEEMEWLLSLTESGEMVHLSISHPYEVVMNKRIQPLLYFSLFLRNVPHANIGNVTSVACKSMQNFHGQFPVLKTEIERFKKSDMYTVFVASDDSQATRLQNVLHDYGIESDLVAYDQALTTERPQIMTLDLQAGFEWSTAKLVVVTEKEIFTKTKKKSRKRQKLSNAERIKSYSELKIGDYVVHINHGIGKYIGIQTLDINGVHKDYLHIKYAGNDQLYVPVEQIDQVQKYVGSEGKEPKIYKLGGTEWTKVKRKVQSSVEDIADDLIALYAEREASKGYAFSEDGVMQQEFEALFPYQETEDQLRTIEEIKRDMEQERPMDRLLCGDVGYGKTEVALRAAFKAVVDQKQVAMLVPTTILAQQHYETMKERFQNYPINIGLLSRFSTRKEQNETIKGLQNGTVDIVVGTHRLLSKDITFRDLGLLVIDEEQRFGVKHKEKIKQLKANIDVLTLTATPIPRTLHMSMLGVRDLSVIETPPENRFPIQTYVVEESGILVREAIERELARDGQVYYLYNRVEDIERKADEISMLVPDARVVYAHGRMTSTELESVMIDFLEGNYDVLVSTTIIETGVDIPNVNTLIVHDADKMGLSQLYQLRGRVGRSNRVAYAYFTYQKDKVLSEVAEKRLQAIKEFTELGSGFKIAMRDLSIRGAGNILGAQQHGFIDSVGFDMYSQMLKDAIEQRKETGEVAKETWKTEIDLLLDAYLPSAYIADENQKIDMYKRFQALDSLEDLTELQDELLDRFGEYPVEVDFLVRVAKIKLYAIREKVESIIQKDHEIKVLFSEETTNMLDGSKVFLFANRIGSYLVPGMAGPQLFIKLNVKKVPPHEYLHAIEQIVMNVTELKREKVESN